MTTPPERLGRENALIIAVLVFTAFIMAVNETALAVALPHIMEEFGITAATAQWLLTGVMLTMAIMMPMTGWILDRFKTRSVYFFAIASFLLGSVICALSPSFPVMLLGRVLQAAGTAVVIPLQMTVVMTVVPPARRGTIMGLISIVLAVGPAFGPTFAGALMAVWTWHSMFWVMATLVAAAGVLGMFFLRNVGVMKRSPLDVVSVILSIFAFGGMVYGLSSIGEIVTGGEGAGIAITLSVVGVVGLVLFVWRQVALKDKALLNLSPLVVRNFVVAAIVIMLYEGVMLGVSNTLPLYAQGALLVTALVAGMINLPGGLIETVISPLAGALYDRVGPRPLVIPGTILGAGALFWMGTVSHTTPVWLVMVMWALFSIGLGMTLTPLMTTAMSSLPGDIYAHGSAILNTTMQLAGAAGTAIMLTTFDLVSAAGGNTPEAMGEGGAAAFRICAVLLTIAAVTTFFLRKPDIETKEVTVAPQ